MGGSLKRRAFLLVAATIILSAGCGAEALSVSSSSTPGPRSYVDARSLKPGDCINLSHNLVVGEGVNVVQMVPCDDFEQREFKVISFLQLTDDEYPGEANLKARLERGLCRSGGGLIPSQVEWEQENLHQVICLWPF